MKYVSFCLYGNDLKYYVGAEKNIELIKKYLPEWTTVIYYSPSNFIKDYEQKLIDLGAKLINVNEIDLIKFVNYPMFWRYFIIFEKGTAIIRDLDSRISEREATYIKNWEESNKDYFIIRDHPWQSLVPGGLVGLKLKDENIKSFFSDFVQNNGLGWGTDQEMLQTYFHKIDRNNIFYCGFDDHTNYIKRDDLNFFIGIQLNENDEPIIPSATLAIDFLKSMNI